LGGCVRNVNVWSEINYNSDEKSTGNTCYELTGTVQEPMCGASRSCGSACGA
jgi:hypothetical protein